MAFPFTFCYALADYMQNIQEFIDLGLSQKSIEAVADKGFEHPTEIQKRCIPILLKGDKDLIGQAQTGTGKTATFALPILEKLDKQYEAGERTHKAGALVLVPTRELCIQVCDEIKSLGANRNVRTLAIYGGASYNIQFKGLKEGADVIVGTPGRIQDHLERGTLSLDSIRFCVLDEADEMLNMGFIDDIENILSQMPEDRQMLCFSATMPEPIRRLAETFMKDYELVKVQTEDMTSTLTRQIYYEVLEEDKFEALCRTVDMAPDFYGIVFCKTKLQCDEVGSRLISAGYNAEVLHGDLSQVQRELIIHKMREHRISILVATDVAARGLDIPDMTHVVNYSLPDEPESYIHRVGRTGRAGKEGLAVTFVTPREFRKFSFIKRIAKSDIQKMRVPSVDELMAERRKTLQDDLFESIKNAETGLYEDALFSMAKKLCAEHHPTNVVTALLAERYGNALNKSKYHEIQDLYDRERQPRTSSLRRRRPTGERSDSGRRARGRNERTRLEDGLEANENREERPLNREERRREKFGEPRERRARDDRFEDDRPSRKPKRTKKANESRFKSSLAGRRGR